MYNINSLLIYIMHTVDTGRESEFNMPVMFYFLYIKLCIYFS